MKRFLCLLVVGLALATNGCATLAECFRDWISDSSGQDDGVEKTYHNAGEEIPYDEHDGE